RTPAGAAGRPDRAPRGPVPRCRTRRSSGPSPRARVWCRERGARAPACRGVPCSRVGTHTVARPQQPDWVRRALNEGHPRTRLWCMDFTEHASLSADQLVGSVTAYAIFLLDPDGRVASWNPGAEQIKGYRADEILGRHFSVFYTPEDVAEGKPGWALETTRAVGHLEDEGWRVRKDGSRFWANVVIAAVGDAQGVLQGFAKVTRALTQRRRDAEAPAQAPA